MDRDVVVAMVEDYWRAVIPAMQNGGPAAVGEVGARFERRVDETAKLMDPGRAAAFLQTIEAERERLIGEYQADPIALKQRLGVSLGVDAPPPRAVGGRQGLGELAVRTAVRATVREGVWSLFRIGR